jgi:hypothetical protein
MLCIVGFLELECGEIYGQDLRAGKRTLREVPRAIADRGRRGCGHGETGTFDSASPTGIW